MLGCANRNPSPDQLSFINRCALASELAGYLSEQIRVATPLLISGETGTGKTTLLNILAQTIPSSEILPSLDEPHEAFQLVITGRETR